MLLVHSQIFSRLDYSNILIAGCCSSLINKLQKVLNAGVRFIFNLITSHSVTEFIKQCYFLPIRYRIKYKSCVTVFKIMNNLSPDYLAHIVQPVIRNRGNLRSSSDSLILELPNCNKCLQYNIIKHWNALPLELRASTSVELFKKSLKTYYFIQAYGSDI